MFITPIDLIKSLSTKNVDNRWRSRTYSQWMSCVPELLDSMATEFVRSFDCNQKDAYDKASVAGIVKIRRIQGIPASEDSVEIYNLATSDRLKGWGIMEQGIGCKGAYIDAMIDEIKRIKQ